MTFPLTATHLTAAGVPVSRHAPFLPPLNAAMQEFGITTLDRPAMFLAQTAHESGGFVYLSEIWGPTPAQKRYDDGGTLARRLGNVTPGDGRKYAGHGLIQITGYLNHKAEAAAFNLSVDDVIMWLQTPVGACRSAGRYWKSHRCNELADTFDFIAVTRAINGGLNGIGDRLARYKRICEAMQ